MEDSEPAPKAPRPRKAAAAKAGKAAQSVAAPVPAEPVLAAPAARKATPAKTAKATKAAKAQPAKAATKASPAAATKSATKAAKTTATPRPPARRTAAATATRTPTATTALPDLPDRPVTVPAPTPPPAAEAVAMTPVPVRPATAERPLLVHQALGAQAREWVDRVRERYPQAGPEALARLATAEFGRAARRHGAAASAAGVLGSVGASGVIAQEQARLVLAIAYVYGFDPMARERADELVDLLRLPRPAQGTRAALTNVGRLVAGVAARRVAAFLVPFGAAAAGAVQGARGCEEVARRAVAHYRRAQETAAR